MTKLFSADKVIKKIGRNFILPSILKRFEKDESGVTAIEFAMLGPAFFGLMWAIIESSLLFFAGQMIESSVDTVGRQVRVGILDKTTTAAQFKTALCNESKLLFDCSKLHVDMKVVADFASLGNKPALVDGELDPDQYSYTAPDAEQIVMITVDYEWPIFTHYMAKALSDMESGNAKISGVAVFRTEPYS